MMNYDNPSMYDLEQFMGALLRRLLFEPVTDPGFVRPAEKLHFLVRQSEEMIARLREIIAEYEQIKASVSEARKILDNETSYMDTVRSFAFTAPSMDPIPGDLLGTVSLPPQERDRRRESQRQVNYKRKLKIYIVNFPC